MDFKIDPRIMTGPQNLQTLSRKQRDLQALKKSSQELESIYVMQMYKAMRKTVPEDGLFEKNPATKIFEEMLDMETARATAKKGSGLGLAQAIYNQMAPLIENKK